jgi:hypothetical protein
MKKAGAWPALFREGENRFDLQRQTFGGALGKGKTAGEVTHLFFHAAEGLWVLDVGQNLVDEVCDLSHFGLFHAPSCHCWGADADSASERDFFGVEGDSVFVDGDTGMIEGLLRLFSIDPFWTEVHQHEMVVGSAGDDPESVFTEAGREGGGVRDDLLCVRLEGGF